MISFIHYGSEKRIYRFPSGNNLANAWEGGGVIDNSLIKHLKPFEDDAEMCLLNFQM